MEDSMDMESMAPLRPQNFLFGCELRADKREYHFKGEDGDDDNEHQLSLRTVSLGATAKDEINIVEAEGMSYEGKPIKVILASLKLSVQPTVSLGGFEITPPVTLRLKSGSGPLHISGQHLVALDEDLESEEEEESPVKGSGKRSAATLPAKLPQKKAKLSVEEDEDEEDEDEDFEDDDEDDDDDDDDEEDEESPVKKPVQVPTAKTPKSNQNGKVSKPSTPAAKQKTPDKTTKDKSPQDKKPQTPKTPKAPFTTEEIKAKILASAEKGVALPKLEMKFQNYVKNCFRTEDPKVFQELWKWRQTLKEFK